MCGIQRETVNIIVVYYNVPLYNSTQSLNKIESVRTLQVGVSVLLINSEPRYSVVIKKLTIDRKYQNEILFLMNKSYIL